MKHYVKITVHSEKAAKMIKSFLEEAIPILEGNIQISKEPEMMRLSEVIEMIEKKQMH